MNNYPPISVISVVAKVFERIMHDHVYAYLSEHNIISKSQSRFSSIYSTVTALLEATDSWAFYVDRGNVNAVVFLDLIQRVAKANLWIINYCILEMKAGNKPAISLPVYFKSFKT